MLNKPYEGLHEFEIMDWETRHNALTDRKMTEVTITVAELGQLIHSVQVSMPPEETNEIYEEMEGLEKEVDELKSKIEKGEKS